MTTVVLLIVLSVNCGSIRSELNQFSEEVHLQNVRQLTFGGINALGSFDLDGRTVIFQANGSKYGSLCDQIYKIDLGLPVEQQVASRLSSGIGAYTNARFFPDSRRILYAGTFQDWKPCANLGANTCPTKACFSNRTRFDPILHKLCRFYAWDLFPAYDIFEVNEYGNVLERLTDTPGYDAEASISPDGSKIVFTSMRSGDPEIWIMDINGSNPVQLTHELGYDGGASFSPDGKKIVFRASRPKTESEIYVYQQLLSYNLVSPLNMEIFTMNIDGTNIRQLTHLGGSNWSPFYMNDNKRIIFTSNYANVGKCGVFSIYIIEEETKEIEQVTFNPGGFDGFPVFNSAGSRFMWSSSRNAVKRTEVNIFVADWVEVPDKRRAKRMLPITQRNSRVSENKCQHLLP
uniref:Uncharacterized protein n=2 Tax=Parascaris univalens TaxID=6257 RepID=A0A915C4G2_PARUN